MKQKKNKAAKSIRLDGDFVTVATAHARASKRSAPKQIEYWARLGKAAEENPDMPGGLVKDAFLATAEMEAGLATPYQRP